MTTPHHDDIVQIYHHDDIESGASTYQGLVALMCQAHDVVQERLPADGRELCVDAMCRLFGLEVLLQ